MGNQLTGVAPSQILPVDHYLTDVVDYEFESNMGSTRFFKVAKARFKEGPAVVKVFVIHDPSLPLKTYSDQVEGIRLRLQNASNCLPFSKAALSDKAALLFREYVKDSLYDRMSTRPFLNGIEKKWIAFQLLCALNQAHKLKVCHGDIKSENVMMSSWTWLLLADFANFKPTYLPEDNPADFSYFFDTSRRRTCYIAPERFIESVVWNSEVAAPIDLTSNEIKKGDLTPAMDIFSAGCVITELFTDGHPPFDLSQLLGYRCGEYSPWKIVEKIDDFNVKMLVRHMMQKDPNLRLSAEEYLIQQRGKAFPEYFYTFLKLYLQRFASPPILAAEERIMRIKKDIDDILKNLDVDKDNSEENTGLVLIISLITSSLRSLRYCHTKLVGLELLLQLTNYVTSEIILDRLIPFMLWFANDPLPRVRAEALHTITECLSRVKTLPRSDANIFPEYILPSLNHLTQDKAVMVRVKYAEKIAQLAETALSFLEMVQLNNTSGETGRRESMINVTADYEVSYDAELQALHEMIQQKVVKLLSDPDNIVKRTLLENGITRLCVFFGRQKANDVLLSHMITFLNDKYDWHLRGSFFDSIVGVAAYVGWQSSTIIKPLMQQGLSDTEEQVIQKTLSALTSMVELGLLQKPLLHEFLTEVVCFLCHPGVYVRHGAVGFVSAIAKSLNIADVHCFLLPLIQPFLKQQIIQVDNEVILLNALKEPVPRSVYDYILRSQLIDKLFESLEDRQLIRNICRPGHKPAYQELDESLNQLFRKLTSQGMTESDEDKLMAMKDFMLKLHRSRAGSSESSSFEEEAAKQGVVNLGVLGNKMTIRHADLIKPLEAKIDQQAAQSRRARKKVPGPESPSITMNEEWKSMFGAAENDNRQAPPSPKLKKEPSPPKGSSTEPQSPGVKPDLPITMSQLQSSLEGIPKKTPLQQPDRPLVQNRHANCKLDLRNLVYKKREQYEEDVVIKDLVDNVTWEERRPLPTNWKPKGLLVAHLHEHRGAVNRIAVSHDNSYFATCSNDGATKIWDCSRMEGKSTTNRSKLTYAKQGGQIRTGVFCESSYSVATVSDNGTIHIIRIETGTTPAKLGIQNTKNINVEETGLVVDIGHFETGSRSVLGYATVNGLLIGWDLRSPTPAWQLQNDPKHGLITSFHIHHQQCWLALGTSSGTHVCWDMRFQLPITTVVHPTGARVRRLITHPIEQSWVMSAVQGNNEVSMWDLETGARQKTLWASTAPPLSTTQASSHSVNGMYFGTTDNSSFLLTAGSDMRLRFWDLNFPSNSNIVAGAASDPSNHTIVTYKSRIIESTEVIQETYSKQRGSGIEDIPRRGPDAPPIGHRDVITDINMCHTTQAFIITSGRDGVVKVWK
ncbi:phosphoinositide 3-kinase regulatory subunit 4-like isoform X2 [Lineus longissimus]|uniref:phosphoinositide 3-kinase regulatory subunit 4-like isoform X2 n=1 Tax=Lineus longissimus TaxID=88925 RepID=UPI002B4C5A4C